MALDNYTDLQAAILSWTGRSGDTRLTAALPDIVLLAETRINYGSEDPDFPSEPLRIRAMEQETDPASFLTVSGQQSLALPTGFLGLTRNRNCYLTTTPIQDLDYVTAQQLAERYMPDTTDQPVVFTVSGNNLLFGPTPDAAYGVVMDYYAAFTGLASAPGGVNGLLTMAPNVYLYGCLLEVALFTRNMTMTETWGRRYVGALNGLMKADKLDRWGFDLQARPDHATP